MPSKRLILVFALTIPLGLVALLVNGLSQPSQAVSAACGQRPIRQGLCR